MVEVLNIKLREKNKLTSTIGLGIGYSKNINSGFYHFIKLDSPTDDIKKIIKACFFIFEKYYENFPIRKVSISYSKLIDKKWCQLDLFENLNDVIKNDSNYKTAIKLHNKFGKNCLVKASALLDDSTIIDRNKKLGGHYE